jgi:hypothetical protein
MEPDPFDDHQVQRLLADNEVRRHLAEDLVRQARERISEIPGALMLLTLMVVGVAGIAWVGCSITEPWAYSIKFGPTLAGKWIGEFVAPDGTRHIVYVRLWDDTDDVITPEMAGLVRMCSGHGDVRQFDLSGKPRNRRGTSFWFDTSIPAGFEGEGLRLGRVEGEWDLRDSLRVTSTLEPYKIHGSVNYPAARRRSLGTEEEPPVVRFTMTRGREWDFTAACDRMDAAAREVTGISARNR